MSSRPVPPPSRLQSNGGVNIGPSQSRSGTKKPESASSESTSEKSAATANTDTREKAGEETSRHGRLSANSSRSSVHPTPHDFVQARSARTPVRTIPAWVRSAEEADLVAEPFSDYFLPSSPQSAFVAQHNHSPWAKVKGIGQHPDNFHSGSPILSGCQLPVRRSRWISFARPSTYPREHREGEMVRPEWLNKHFTDYSKPWLADHNEDDVEDGSGRYHAFRRKRKTWYKRTQQTILRNPMIPLVFRMTVFTFSAVALALGEAIRRQAKLDQFSHGPSAMMAIIVDAVALVYILYITYDEYTGKPLGLRPAKAKLKVLLLDLFFIVFQSATLGLAFQNLTDPNEACTRRSTGTLSNATDAVLCRKQRSLASVLLIALIAWLNTFCVSVLRLVERVAQR